MRQTERDQARSFILEGYSIEEIVSAFTRAGDGDEAETATRQWAFGLAQEIKQERRQQQAADFRAYVNGGQ